MLNNTNMKHMNSSLPVVSLLFCLFLLSTCAKDEVDTMGDIHGIVSDESGTPLQAASVTLTPTGKTTTTGDDGRFEFNDLEPQQYTLSVTKVDYVSNSKTLTIRAGEASKGDLILVKGLPQLKVNVTELVFGNADDILSFEITNSGVGLLEWQIKEEADWISLEPTHGQTTKGISPVSVRIDRAGLSPDVEHVYTLNVISTSGGAKEVRVKVLAKTPKRLVVAPLQLDFSVDKTEEYLTIKKESGEGNISYSFSVDRDWTLLSGNVSGEIGEVETEIKVSVVREGLSAGVHKAAITITALGTRTVTIPVSVTVKAVESYESVTIESCDPRIQVEIVNCRRSGTSVVLNYTIKNAGIERDIGDFRVYPVGGMLGRSEIYDNNDKKYTYTTIILGTASASSQAVQNSLPFGVKVSESITIKNFSATASQLSLVKMECLAYPNSIYKLADKFFTFRDVPIY